MCSMRSIDSYILKQKENIVCMYSCTVNCSVKKCFVLNFLLLNYCKNPNELL